MRGKAHFRDAKQHSRNDVCLHCDFAIMVTFHGTRFFFFFFFLGHVTELSIKYQATYIPFERDQVIT